ncbi:hypothetical protein PF010_g13726 [Phytophthora fragariae]|uniref:Uncharacterized protein n=1 Tax=Phytophthora fragariae TaxID=53985 RepID=A0A6A3TV08_9STRA|nr:hypothetical protein PF011_g5441 [Phytophthora fragariae]KAE9103478.1 hypothetical protein PF010_g13726 [Phytophthora fragariae]KAE9141118.1 hypothetical protein PF006_g13349 [Phytophthora fragariae]KAE9244498.1 hypothetical protein PF002_g7727 [Phytophthora fragariae]KAE9318917.1 hypothetical protein PF001_g6135 [Phytophthora fragariae]
MAYLGNCQGGIHGTVSYCRDMAKASLAANAHCAGSVARYYCLVGLCRPQKPPQRSTLEHPLMEHFREECMAHFPWRWAPFLQPGAMHNLPPP